jgi:hypothetical protein
MVERNAILNDDDDNHEDSNNINNNNNNTILLLSIYRLNSCEANYRDAQKPKEFTSKLQTIKHDYVQ